MVALACAAALVWPRCSFALEGCSELERIERVELGGLARTLPGTITALLPRPAPSVYTAPELRELERRLNNLGIFDRVRVACEPPALRVDVREKWTLVPTVDFATGRTFADLFVELGATEYNFLGTADSLSLSAYRERRGFGFSLAYEEHAYQRHGWSLGAELAFGTLALRFEDDSGWRTTGAALTLSARSPPWPHEYFNYVAGFYVASDTVHEIRSEAAPPSVWLAQSFMVFSWDAYEWHDLVPSGISASLVLNVGGAFGPRVPDPRHNGALELLEALRIDARTVLLARGLGSIGTRGNANYGATVGSVDGVRGLGVPTSVNWVQGVANLELRRSFLLSARWALQAVAFTDAAAFEEMSVAGGRGGPGAALSVGAGLRVIPTWIASITPRLDLARLLEPERVWFLQLGLNQYF
jgi:hypothetical protein